MERELSLQLTGLGEERRNLERIARVGVARCARGTLPRALTEIPARIQARLARLFRDREAMIVQDRNAVGFDVRAIAAADAAYDQAVEEGRIRNDLHRVISTIRIDVPPLRERREDIPGLAGHFLAAMGRRSGPPPKTLSEPAL